MLQVKINSFSCHIYAVDCLEKFVYKMSDLLCVDRDSHMLAINTYDSYFGAIHKERPQKIVVFTPSFPLVCFCPHLASPSLPCPIIIPVKDDVVVENWARN